MCALLPDHFPAKLLPGIGGIFMKIQVGRTLSLLLIDFRVLIQASLSLWGHTAGGRGGGWDWLGRQPVYEDRAEGSLWSWWWGWE